MNKNIGKGGVVEDGRTHEIKGKWKTKEDTGRQQNRIRRATEGHMMTKEVKEDKGEAGEECEDSRKSGQRGKLES